MIRASLQSVRLNRLGANPKRSASGFHELKAACEAPVDLRAARFGALVNLIGRFTEKSGHHSLFNILTAKR